MLVPCPGIYLRFPGIFFAVFLLFDLLFRHSFLCSVFLPLALPLPLAGVNIILAVFFVGAMAVGVIFMVGVSLRRQWSWAFGWACWDNNVNHLPRSWLLRFLGRYDGVISWRGRYIG